MTGAAGALIQRELMARLGIIDWLGEHLCDRPAGLGVDGMVLAATATDNPGNTAQFSRSVPLGEQPELDDRIFSDRFEEE